MSKAFSSEKSWDETAQKDLTNAIGAGCAIVQTKSGQTQQGIGGSNRLMMILFLVTKAVLSERCRIILIDRKACLNISNSHFRLCDEAPG